MNVQNGFLYLIQTRHKFTMWIIAEIRMWPDPIPQSKELGRGPSGIVSTF